MLFLSTLDVEGKSVQRFVLSVFLPRIHTHKLLLGICLDYNCIGWVNVKVVRTHTGQKMRKLSLEVISKRVAVAKVVSERTEMCQVSRRQEHAAWKAQNLRERNVGGVQDDVYVEGAKWV